MSSEGDAGIGGAANHGGSSTRRRHEGHGPGGRGEPPSGLEQVRTVAGAALAAAYLVGSEREELRLADAAGGSVGRYGLPMACPLSARALVADAVRSNRPLWLDAAQVASYGGAAAGSPGVRVSLGVVPLSAVPPGEGGVAPGCLVVVGQGPEAFDVERRILVELYAEQVSAAMDAGRVRALHIAARTARPRLGLIGARPLKVPECWTIRSQSRARRRACTCGARRHVSPSGPLRRPPRRTPFPRS